jgi:multiple sugar transport system substrate-binding protein
MAMTFIAVMFLFSTIDPQTGLSGQAAWGATAAGRALNGIKALMDAGKVKRGENFKIMIHSGQRGQLAPVVEKLNRLTGLNAEVVVIGFEPDIHTKAMNEAVVKSGQFDLFLGFSNWTGDFAEAGLIVPLDEWVAKYSPEVDQGPSAFVVPLDRFTTRYKGKFYALGMDNDAFVLFYRKDLFEDPTERANFKAKYGRLLTLPETWKEFDQLAEFFDRPAKGIRGAHLYSTRFFTYTSWAPRFVSKGGIYFDPKTMNPMINTSGGVKALQEHIDVTQKHMFAEAYTGDWSVSYDRFPAGQIFMAVAWPSLGQFAEDPEVSKIAGKVGFAKFPGSRLKGKLIRATPHVVGWSLTVSRYGKSPEVGYLIAQWLNSPSVSTEVITTKGTLDPFRQNHFENRKLMQTYGPELGPVLRENTEQSFPDISLRGSNEYLDVLNLNLQSAVTGQISAKAALEKTAAKWQEITNRLGREEQLKAWQSEIKGYPRHIRELWVDLGKVSPAMADL